MTTPEFYVCRDCHYPLLFPVMPLRPSAAVREVTCRQCGRTQRARFYREQQP